MSLMSMPVKLRKQTGVHLVESMITVFVLTVGILGVAGLQAVAIRSHRDSYHINQAMIMAQNMADRVRANLQAADNFYYDQSPSGNAGVYTAACFSTSGCTSEQMAYTDIYQWNALLSEGLSEGEGLICRDSTVPAATDLAGTNLRSQVLNSCDGVGDVYVIHIMWDANNDGNLQLNVDTDTGALEPHSSDGYVQLAFEP